MKAEPQPRKAPATGRRTALLACFVLLASCSPVSGKQPAILDSAFVALHPELSAAIAKAASSPFSKANCETIGLEKGTGALLASARRMGFQPGKVAKSRLVTSPLFTLAFLDGERGIIATENRTGIDALGGALLVVPEWQGPAPAEVIAVRSDFTPAFEAAGRAAGKYIAALAAEKAEAGRAPEAAILFRASSARGREALDAFSSACEKAAGRPPLVREIRAGAEEGEIEEAAKELLAEDIRIVLVALGEDEGTAFGLLENPGIALGAESGGSEDYAGAAFLIRPDNASLARALGDVAMRARGGDCIGVAARLEARPSAGDFKAGKRSLAEIIRERS